MAHSRYQTVVECCNWLCRIRRVEIDRTDVEQGLTVTMDLQPETTGPVAEPFFTRFTGVTDLSFGRLNADVISRVRVVDVRDRQMDTVRFHVSDDEHALIRFSCVAYFGFPT